jgi:hypothetical protein
MRRAALPIAVAVDEQCRGLPKTPEAQFAWSFFGTSTNEVVGRGFFDEPSGRKVLASRIRTPGRDIDAALCPLELPRLVFDARVEIQCEGGELGERVEFSANVRTSPNPERAMGGELFATLDDGSMIGPFTITGPLTVEWPGLCRSQISRSTSSGRSPRQLAWRTQSTQVRSIVSSESKKSWTPWKTFTRGCACGLARSAHRRPGRASSP